VPARREKANLGAPKVDPGAPKASPGKRRLYGAAGKKGKIVFDPAVHCGGQRTKSPPGTLCTLRKGAGTKHKGTGRCARHGGNTPTHVKAAQKIMAEEAVVRFALPRDIGPYEALTEDLNRTVGWIDFFEERARVLEPDALIWGVTSTSREGLVRGKAQLRTAIGDTMAEARGEDDGGDNGDHQRRLAITKVEEAVGVNQWLKLSIEQRRHMLDLCRTMITCGLIERQVRVDEAMSMAVASRFKAFVEALGLDPSAPHVIAAMRVALTGEPVMINITPPAPARRALRNGGATP